MSRVRRHIPVPVPQAASQRALLLRTCARTIQIHLAFLLLFVDRRFASGSLMVPPRSTITSRDL